MRERKTRRVPSVLGNDTLRIENFDKYPEFLQPTVRANTHAQHTKHVRIKGDLIVFSHGKSHANGLPHSQTLRT